MMGMVKKHQKGTLKHPRQEKWGARAEVGSKDTISRSQQAVTSVVGIKETACLEIGRLQSKWENSPILHPSSETARGISLGPLSSAILNLSLEIPFGFV